MATKLCSKLFQQLTFRFDKQKFRSFLSTAYRCDDVWNKRLQHPLLSNISPTEYFYDLDRKYRNEGLVSAIDVDLFVNKLDHSNSKNFIDEAEDLVMRLRGSRETIHTMPSTPHALIRILMDAGNTEILLKILDNPLLYGIFPDYFIANVLMDKYIEEENYTVAARVAAIHMLQEDFGPPLTQALTLASAYGYTIAENNPPWEDYSPKKEEPVEEVKIRVPFVRNPYFDDHFDLKEPNHIVGKTLAFVSPLIGRSLGVSCELLGWALYEKWGDLEAALQRANNGEHPIAASVIASLKELTSASEDPESQERIQTLLMQLEASRHLVKEIDVAETIKSLVEKEVKKAESDDIKGQEQVYKEWEKIRENEVQRQIREFQKKQLLEEIDEKKKDLAAREEVIFFFDNEEKLKLLLPKSKYYPPKKSLIYGKKKPRKVDEGYIPPEITRR